MRSARIVAALAIGSLFTFNSTLLTGCASALDDRQNRLIESFATASTAHAEVTETVVGLADKMAGKYHGGERARIDGTFQTFIAGHTDAQGRLVSKQPDGTFKPLAAADLLAEIASHDEAVRRVDLSEAGWAGMYARLVRANADFRAATNTLLETNADIEAAKKSVQQFLDSTIGAVSGIAAGFGIGVAVVP